jgi:hypothetical protein
MKLKLMRIEIFHFRLRRKRIQISESGSDGPIKN